MQVGEVSELFIGAGEKTLFDVDNTGAQLYILFNSPSENEIKQVSQDAKFDIRFALVQGEIFVLFKCGTLNWMDAAYAPQLSRNLSTLPKVKDGQGLALVLSMIDVPSGKVQSLRLIGMETEFSRNFISAISERMKRPFDKVAYYHTVSEIMAKYTTEELLTMCE